MSFQENLKHNLRMSVTLHTDLGDLKFELFCKLCPKTCENFLALVASGKYDGTVFHRNIPGFIVQGGDPTGTGKGGESIWVSAHGSPFILNSISIREDHSKMKLTTI